MDDDVEISMNEKLTEFSDTQPLSQQAKDENEKDKDNKATPLTHCYQPH